MIGWWEPGGRLGWELLYDFLIKTLWRRICFLNKWDLLVWAKGFTWDSFSVKYLPCRLLNTGQNMAAVNYTFPWDFKNRFPPQLFFWARTQIGWQNLCDYERAHKYWACQLDPFKFALAWGLESSSDQFRDEVRWMWLSTHRWQHDLKWKPEAHTTWQGLGT